MTEKQLTHLTQEVQKDDLYQDFIKLLDMYQPEYLRILEQLPYRDQHLLKQYISLSIALEERLTRTAYFLMPLEDADEYESEDDEYDSHAKFRLH